MQGSWTQECSPKEVRGAATPRRRHQSADIAGRIQAARNCAIWPLEKKFAELQGGSQTSRRRSAAPPQAAFEGVHHWQRAEPHGDTGGKEPEDSAKDASSQAGHVEHGEGRRRRSPRCRDPEQISAAKNARSTVATEVAVVLEEGLPHEVEARSHKRPPEGNGRKRRQSRASKKAGQTRRLETNHLNPRGRGKGKSSPRHHPETDSRPDAGFGRSGCKPPAEAVSCTTDSLHRRA